MKKKNKCMHAIILLKYLCTNSSPQFVQNIICDKSLRGEKTGKILKRLFTYKVLILIELNHGDNWVDIYIHEFSSCGGKLLVSRVQSSRRH